MRRVASSNEFFDILDKIGNGKFVTIGYVTGANLDVPTVSRKNPLTNRMKKYPDYSVFGSEEEIGALVKITSYNMRYLNRTTVGQKYGEYKNSANDIRSQFGLDPIASKESYKQGTDWSPNGPELYKGQNTDLQSHSYNPQNLYGVKPRGVVYAVNKEGHIITALSQEQIQPYLKKKREIDGVAALRKMGAEEERIQDYISKIGELKFKYINFESNSILWIAATINGEKIVYINDNLSRAVDGIDIRPEDFRAIARERYQIDLTNLQEIYKRENMGNKKIFRMTESDLRGMIGESVRKILSELDWRTYASAAKKGNEFRRNNPHTARQWNRVYDFDNAATDAFNKQHGLENQYDNGAYGGDKGSMNLHSSEGEVEFGGSRDHDFGDGGGPFNLNHNVYHMGKKYGKDGGYGRTRMWDVAHETTPEEFYGDEEMGKKFRDAEQEVDDFKSGKTHYVKGKGWSNEGKISKKPMKEGWNFSPDQLDDKAYMDDFYANRERMFQDDWEMRNRRLRQKYPGKSEEWYEAMIDTFYESKKGKKTINEIGDTSNGQYAMGKLAARQQYRDKNSKGAFQTSWKAGDQQSNDRKGDNMNKAFHQGKSDGQKQFMKEETFQNNQNYSHFAVNKATNKIVNGWDYADYDPSELRQFKNDYFTRDLIEYDLDPKQYKIVTGKYLLRQGIDPNDNNNWANN